MALNLFAVRVKNFTKAKYEKEKLDMLWKQLKAQDR